MAKIRHACEYFISPEPSARPIRPRNRKTIQEKVTMKVLLLLLFPLPALGGYWLMGQIDRFIRRIHRW